MLLGLVCLTGLCACEAERSASAAVHTPPELAQAVFTPGSEATTPGTAAAVPQAQAEPEPAPTTELEPAPKPHWIRHQPVPQETIEQIALRYGAKPEAVRRANGFAEGEQPRKRKPPKLKVYAKKFPPPRHMQEHTVVDRSRR